MGCLRTAVILGVITLGLLAYFSSDRKKSPPQVVETWWTPGTERLSDNKIEPFRVTFSKELVQDLKYRLKHTRNLTPPLKDVAWNYGTNTDVLHKFLDYWMNNYNFQEREKFINQYPHFKTNIQGLDIHFLRIKPKNPEGKRVLPLLILHGWPGSIMEFYKVIPSLTTPKSEQDFVFEVIAPSLPGFGFSSAATIPGLSATHMAIVLKNLMLRLGFNEFYAQGGDWGAGIVNDMSALFPQHVLGMHSNMCGVQTMCTFLKEILYTYLPSFLSPSDGFKPKRSPKEEFLFTLVESGYFHIQATKPDTVGVALADSPAGLASYVVEKFSTGTNRSYKSRVDGGFLEKYTYDELIDNLMMYWAPNSMTTAMRIYAEAFSKQELNPFNMMSVPITVPSACVQFPNEIRLQAPNILKHRYINLIRVTRMPRGGHFAALEEPELLANDIWASIDEMETLKKNSKKDKKEKSDL